MDYKLFNEKEFQAWHILKNQIHSMQKPIPHYKVAEIWWMSTGKSVGIEENGKGRLFSRPVLIIQGFNTRQFWGLTLSTTKRSGK